LQGKILHPPRDIGVWATRKEVGVIDEQTCLMLVVVVAFADVELMQKTK